MTVNSNPVPFFMKVGDAGEAFFVVETEEDVPEELLTSPLLGATEVIRTNRACEGAGDVGRPWVRFGGDVEVSEGARDALELF